MFSSEENLKLKKTVTSTFQVHTHILRVTPICSKRKQHQETMLVVDKQLANVTLYNGY